MNPIVSSTAATTASSLPSISSRDEQKIRAAKAAVDSMTVRQDKASDERKAIAKKKAEELKARIQMLKMSMPANPEAAGKIIAQLARELGAIVKSYGGSGSDAGVGADASATSAGGGEAAASGAAATVAASGSEDAPVPAEASPDASSGATPKDPYRAAMAAQAAANADQARKADGAREDSEFATTVKQLLAELKAMKAKAEADAKAAGDPNTPEVADADKALAAVDAALGDAGLSGSMVSLVV
jgi:hypothetical protein